MEARGVQCAASVHFTMDSTSTNVYLYKSSETHTCDHIENKSGPKMTIDVEVEIANGVANKMKPLAIMDILAQKKLPIPKMYQIKNHMAKIK